jgi:hypothetical protein
MKRKKQPYEYTTLRLHLSNVTYKECVNKCQFSYGGGGADNDIVGGGDDDIVGGGDDNIVGGEDDDDNNNMFGTSHIIRKVLQCET